MTFFKKILCFLLVGLLTNCGSSSREQSDTFETTPEEQQAPKQDWSFINKSSLAIARHISAADYYITKLSKKLMVEPLEYHFEFESEEDKVDMRHSNLESLIIFSTASKRLLNDLSKFEAIVNKTPELLTSSMIYDIEGEINSFISYLSQIRDDMSFEPSIQLNNDVLRTLELELAEYDRNTHYNARVIDNAN